MWRRLRWALAGFIAAIFVIFALALFAPDQLAAASPQADGAESGYAQARPVPGLPGYRFAEVLDSKGAIRQILVYGDGQQQAEALDSCTGTPIKPQGDVGEVTAADYNFDGYPDLAMVSADQRGETTYCVWLFSLQTQQFVLSPELSRIPNPQIYPPTKSIVSRVDEGCAGGCFEENTYTWDNGQLKLVQSISQDEETQLRPEEDCRFVRTVRREENGRMVEEPRQMISRGGLPCGPVQRY